jgi:N-methylhydantoinase A/oxoprolinase/acetone carboxylase beta subunit
LAERLNLSVTEAAWGIHEIANDNMSTAARIHLVERGKDPGGFAFVAFGGAGPTHAQGVAKKLGVKRIIIPRNAGVMSAVGLLAAPMSFDVISSGVRDLAAVEWSGLHERFDRLADEARQQLSGIPEGQVRIVRSADMRYRGQGSEISVAIPGEAYERGLDAAALTDLFSKAYDETYGRHIEGAPIQLVNLRVRAVAAAGDFAFTPVKDASSEAAPHCRAMVYFPEQGYVGTKIYRQKELIATQKIAGPAIVRSEEFSALIAPEQHAVVDRFGNLDISI